MSRAMRERTTQRTRCGPTCGPGIRRSRRRSETETARRLADTTARLGKGTDTLARIERESADAVTEADSIRAHLGELAERVEQVRARRAELQRQLPGLEADEQSAADASRRLQERAAAVAALRTDLEIRATGVDERRSYLERRLEEVETSLSRNVDERRDAEARRIDLD